MGRSTFMDSAQKKWATYGGYAMKQEITEFYNKSNIPIERMVAIGVARQNLTREAIQEAASVLYNEIKCGLEIKPIRVAWEVFARAKHLVIQAKASEDTRLKSLQSEVNRLHKYIRQPWYKRLLPYKSSAKEGN